MRELDRRSLHPASQKRADEFSACDSVRLQSALSLLKSIRWEPEHAAQVTRLALSFFDQLQPVHKPGPGARDILAVAGLLHDIGWAIDRKQHHKHTMHLILEGGLDGFDARERLLVANVARYHRRALPSQNHKLYCILTEQEQRMVSVLASILRIADGLDRTHQQAIRGLTVEWSEDACRITLLWAHGVPNIADLEGALHKADLFREVFNLPVVFDFEKNDP